MQNIKCQRICLNQIRQKLGYCLSIIKCSDGGTLHCGCPNFSSVSIVTSAEWPRNHGSIPGRGTRLFFSPNHLDHFCGQPSLLFNGYWAFLNREYSRRGVKLTTHLHLQCLLKNAWSYTSHIVVLIKHSTSVLLYGLRRSIYIQKKKKMFQKLDLYHLQVRWTAELGQTKRAILNQWTTCVYEQPLHMHPDTVKCTALSNLLVCSRLFSTAESYLYTAA